MESIIPKDRVLNIIHGDSLDFFPDQIDFTLQAERKFCKYLRLKERKKLFNYVNNHIKYTYSLNSHLAWLGENSKVEAETKGFIKLDKKNNIVYDDWGIGWAIDMEGIQVLYHPLEKIGSLKGVKFPNPSTDGLMDKAKGIIVRFGQRYLVTSFQHILLFEKAWALRGFEQLLIDILANKKFVNQLLDIITEYQIQVAKCLVKIGVQCAFTGDDYGTQQGLVMAPNAWRKLFKPRLKMIWEIY